MATERVNGYRDYRVSMVNVKSLLDKELIAPEEYVKINVIWFKYTVNVYK